jgi:hypothetical protein
VPAAEPAPAAAQSTQPEEYQYQAQQPLDPYYAQQPAGEPAAAAPPPAQAGPAPEQKEEPPEEEGTKFAWFSLSPQVGFAYFPEASIEVKGIPLKVNPRNVFIFKLHLDLGGDGLALELAPLFAIEADGSEFGKMKVDLGDSVGGGLGGDFVAIGGQATLVYRFDLSPFFPHLGLGFHGAGLISDNIESGTELYGRVPIGFTWYMAEYLGLVVEFGLMWGATGIKGKGAGDIASEIENFDPDQYDPEADYDPNDPDAEAKARAALEAELAKKLQFGTGFGFDLMVGLRFP